MRIEPSAKWQYARINSYEESFELNSEQKKNIEIIIKIGQLFQNLQMLLKQFKHMETGSFTLEIFRNNITSNNPKKCVGKKKSNTWIEFRANMFLLNGIKFQFILQNIYILFKKKMKRAPIIKSNQNAWHNSILARNQ